MAAPPRIQEAAGRLSLLAGPVVVGVLALLALLPACGVAEAAGVGALVQLPAPGDCVEQDATLLSIGAEGCAGTAGRGLQGASSVAVTPDGRDVYVTSGGDVSGSNGLAEFSRDPVSGALTQFGCISETGAECDFKAAGLESDESVVVSPDGALVYVSSPAAGVDVFARAPDGSLSLLQCFKRTGDAGDASCTALAELEGARGLAVSPDGRFLYAAEQNGNAIATFERIGGGKLAYQGCISESLKAGLTTCAQTNARGLYGVTGLAISPDGARLYAVSYADNALVTFARSSAGPLTDLSCESTGAASLCSEPNAPGLANAQQVAVNGDGSRIYVVTLEGALSTFAPTGLGTTEVGCLSAKGKEAACTSAGADLEGGTGIVLAPAAAPGGGSLYTASFFAQAVDAFAIDPASGLPIPLAGGDACVAAAGSSAGCGVTGHGLNSADGIAASADGRNIYVASRGEQAVLCGSSKCSDNVSAVASFARVPVPAPAPAPAAPAPPVAPVPQAPVLSHLRLSHATVHRHGRSARSTVLAYTDSEPATTTITVEMASSGVRRGGHCVRGTAHSRRTRCSYERVLVKITHADLAGTNRVTLKAKIGRVQLRPGRYTLVLIARSPYGSSRSASVSLRIV